MRAQQLLDQLLTIAKLDAFDPDAYGEALAAELPADHETRDAALRQALLAIDALTSRAMKVRIELEDALEPATRNVFAGTVLSYAAELGLLAQRARDAAVRGRAGDPGTVARHVVDAAESALALRHALYERVLAIARARAAADIAATDVLARDRRIDDTTRLHHAKLRRDLAAIAAAPETMIAAPIAARLAALPNVLDEPDPSDEPRFEDLIELD